MKYIAEIVKVCCIWVWFVKFSVDVPTIFSSIWFGYVYYLINIKRGRSSFYDVILFFAEKCSEWCSNGTLLVYIHK